MPGRARRGDVRDEPRVYRAIVRFRGNRALLAGIVALAVLAALPLLVGEGGLMSSLVITLILFIAVLGLDILMGYAGQVSLGQAAFMAIGGYTPPILPTNYALPPLLRLLTRVALAPV